MPNFIRPRYWGHWTEVFGGLQNVMEENRQDKMVKENN